MVTASKGQKRVDRIFSALLVRRNYIRANHDLGLVD